MIGYLSKNKQEIKRPEKEKKGTFYKNMSLGSAQPIFIWQVK